MNDEQIALEALRIGTQSEQDLYALGVINPIYAITKLLGSGYKIRGVSAANKLSLVYQLFE